MKRADPASTPAHRAAESLGKIDPHRIERPGVVGGRDARGNLRVQEPRSVHVRRQAVLPGDARDRLDDGEGPDRAARPVCGLLDRTSRERGTSGRWGRIAART